MDRSYILSHVSPHRKCGSPCEKKKLASFEPYILIPSDRSIRAHALRKFPSAVSQNGFPQNVRRTAAPGQRRLLLSSHNNCSWRRIIASFEQGFFSSFSGSDHPSPNALCVIFLPRINSPLVLHRSCSSSSGPLSATSSSPGTTVASAAKIN